MMKAARFHEYGGADVIRVERVPVPEPGAGEVLVRIAATSFNPSDTALRAGRLREVLPLALPYVPGWDVAGTVVTAAGRWKAGDRVMGRTDAGGAAAEFAAVPASVLVGVTGFAELAAAAAVPVAGLTAWQAVFEHGKVAAGQRVLINGAGGGVGGFAVQLAKLAGATVIATASPRSAATVAGLGADEVIDYTRSPLPEGMDVVINLAPVGPEQASVLATLVRPGGAGVSVAAPIRGFFSFTARNDPGQVAEMDALAAAGTLLVDVTETVPLEGLADLHRRSEAGLTRGKILVAV
ncbi:NADP-dependent oxidoreductase [Nonomuraea soli]|uniref:NADPH:quinone reductase-like Zn-dependent oxidoreductase n=1 Tax=Nonomuraea soli TaxID=1032476 RepID=A0A7W0HU65_9ACTN|nr:NADP-dependent oxidoreductase [Nonomuraea soli]MBA2895765.1 NADPH:quinone reductase-like Zn-dependent oxidoreductase [Nonomuraea soli]